MSKVDDGGRAFPCTNRRIERDVMTAGSDGMTLRDYFAAKALAGMLEDMETMSTFDEFAADAYRYADAMLAARKAPQ